MEIALTSEQIDFVRHAVDEGRVQNPNQAVQEAMALWIERERRRFELVASLDAAEASLARGEGMTITRESMTTLAGDVMAAARVRRHFTLAEHPARCTNGNS